LHAASSLIEENLRFFAFFVIHGSNNFFLVSHARILIGRPRLDNMTFLIAPATGQQLGSFNNKTARKVIARRPEEEGNLQVVKQGQF
jgi:hypothetical protein